MKDHLIDLQTRPILTQFSKIPSFRKTYTSYDGINAHLPTTPKNANPNFKQQIDVPNTSKTKASFHKKKK